MNIGRRGFNLYLFAALTMLLACGCALGKHKQPHSALRVHIQATDSTTFPKKIKLKNPPVQMSVDKSPLLTDLDVEDAKVVNALGGFALEIQFDKRGKWLLDQHSSLNLGRHLAIFAEFEVNKTAKAEWIAAPIISNRISDGKIIFTPNLTKEEAEIFAEGLSHKTGLDKPPKDSE